MKELKELKPGKSYEVMAEVVRVKKEVATVIMIEGKRYVLDMGQGRKQG